MNKHHPIRLTDLAKKLKISPVTVSKALRNHPDISEKTTERVHALADKVGYFPNKNARNLSSRNTKTIGLIVPKIAHVFFASIIDEIYEQAFQKGYEVILTVSQENPERENQQIQTLLSMQVDGLIISVTQESKDTNLYDRIKARHIPIVFVDRTLPIADITKVTVDDASGAELAVDYAVERGYSRIAHVGGYNHLSIGNKRREGFYSAMKRHHLEIRKEWDLEGGLSEVDGHVAFEKIIDSGEIPQYIFAITYPVALGIYQAASEKRIKIPDQVEVTCFGVHTFYEGNSSVFNFISQPARELARVSFEELFNQMKNPKDATIKDIVLPIHFEHRSLFQ